LTHLLKTHIKQSILPAFGDSKRRDNLSFARDSPPLRPRSRRPEKNLPANCREKRPKDTMPSDIRKLDKKALQTWQVSEDLQNNAVT
jgi:hypothetical protein